MHPVEPASAREATDILVKILDSTYAKTDFRQVANNKTQLNAEERAQLLKLLEDFEEFLMVI